MAAHRGRRPIEQRAVVSVRNLLVEELRKEMVATVVVSAAQRSEPLNMDWGRLLRRAASEPDFHPKRVVEMQLLKQVIRIILHRQFDDVRRSEMRRHPAKKSWHTLYTMVFKQGEGVLGYAAMINIPDVNSEEVEKSSGTLHAVCIKSASSGGEEMIVFEDARFDDYSAEVKPHIEVLGNLYRRTRRL